MSTISKSPQPRRRWLQFSLRGLLLLTAAVAVLLGWTLHKVHQQRVVVADLEKMGYSVSYRYTASGPATMIEWLRKLSGVHEFRDVIGVGGGPLCYDAGLVRLPELAQVQTLALDGTQITDAGLAQLRGLTQLQCLVLVNTNITDAGLVHLRGLSQLRSVTLEGRQITDAGLVHLRGLSQLRGLGLDHTSVTDAGLVHLRGLNQLETLVLRNTRVTDAGLVHLRGLSQLQDLDLSLTISLPAEAGRNELMKALPNLKVRD